MGDTRNYAALEWVIGEIGDTLKEARQALEAYVEDPRDSTRIRFCLTHIHQVHGTLQMVEFHGASLLAEEMEQLAQALLNDAVSSTSEAHEVLMRSLLQLPIYLDHVKTQRDDHPGVILPLLNDLRAVRKQGYLSETNLFAPNLAAARPQGGQRHPAAQDPQKLKQVLVKLREMYQFSAAAVLRGVKLEENLAYLTKVCTRLESLTSGTSCYPLWNLAAALAEALERDDLELSVAVRGLLRHLARELRVLMENSPASLDQPPRESLLKNLLFYVARAENGSPRVDKIKQAYQLDHALLYGSSGRTSDRDFISAPDPEAIRSVVVALQDEINSIKHILDISLTGHGGQEDLVEVLPIVKRVADTLAVLGIGDLRKQISEQHQVLTEICNAGQLDEDRLMQVAGRIIEIEHRLQAVAKGAGKTRDLGSVDERGMEIDMAKAAVLAECQKGLEQAKDAIVEYIASKWDASHLANVSGLMSDIRGGLEMIPLRRPAAIMATCGRFVQERLLDAKITPDWETLDKLADTIASVDYYLERLREDREEDLDGFLDIAEQSIKSLGYSLANDGSPAHSSNDRSPSEQTGGVPADEQAHGLAVDAREDHVATPDSQASTEQHQPEIEVADAEWGAPTGESEESAADDESTSGSDYLDLTSAEPASISEASSDTASGSESDTEAPAHDSDDAGARQDDDAGQEMVFEPVALGNDDALTEDVDEFAEADFPITAEVVEPAAELEEESDIDDEILEIFIEEAGEVQETLAEYFPQWRQDPDDQDSLTIVRRAFHTLKGSGRMVEAYDVGELAWSIENMLNRVIDKTIEPEQPHFALIGLVLELLPTLVSAFEHRQSNPEKALTEQYMAWAFAAADGDVPAELVRAAERGEAGKSGIADVQPADSAYSESADDNWLAEQELGNSDARFETDAEPWSSSAWNRETASAAPDATSDDSDDGEDLVLWDIFASEAETHLAAVEEFIAQMEQAAPLYTPPSDSMQRALHTLKGSAHMAHVTPIAELATPFESFVKELRAYQVNITDDILQLIKDGVDYTRVGLEAIGQGRSVELPKLPQFLARTAELRELAVGALVRQKEAERDGLKQVDPRLLSIFMAEEMKLLLDADEILDRWQQDFSDLSEINPLVTELTTLQTGADQANLPEMATLSQLLRDIYTACQSDKLEPSAALVAQLQRGHDVLLDLVDAVAAGQNLQPLSSDLMDDLNGLLTTHTPLVDWDDQSETAEIDYAQTGLPVAEDLGEEPTAELQDTFSASGDANWHLPEVPDTDLDFDYNDVQTSLAQPDTVEVETGVEDAGELEPALEPFGGSDEDLESPAQTDCAEVDLEAPMDSVFEVDAEEELGDEGELLLSADEADVDARPPAEEAEQPGTLGDLPSKTVSGFDKEIDSASVEATAGDEPESEIRPESLPYEGAEAESESDPVAGSSAQTQAESTVAEDSAPSNEWAAESGESDSQWEELGNVIDGEEHKLDADLEFDLGASDSTADDEALAAQNKTITKYADLSDVGSEAASPESTSDDLEMEDRQLTVESESVADTHDDNADAEQHPSSTDASPSPASLLDLSSDEFDPDIIEIFLEEADELIDDLDEAIHSWESNWEDVESVETMARALHTLKGGARLANLMALGELTHEYESFLLGKNKDELTQGFFESLHAYQDKLLRDVRAVHAAAAGEAPPADPNQTAAKPKTETDTETVAQASTDKASSPSLEPLTSSPAVGGKANVVPFAPKPKDTSRGDHNFGSGASGGNSFAVPPAKSGGAQPAAQPAPRRAGPQEVIKISAELLEELVNLAGETSISRGRLETQINDLGSAVEEIDGTLSRLQEQLRRLDIETEAQIIFRQEQLADHEDFDPLEMDRYSALQQLSRSLMESASDLVDLKSTLTDKIKDTETLLLQQSRVNTNLQEGLMRSRMVPFSRLVPRLRRIVRQVAAELGKQVDFELDNIEGELDRSVLERMVAPLEHMLRNAVDHGIEMPADRAATGKPEAGRVHLSLAREGGDVLLRLSDDGRGINLKRVREKAIERGLMSADAQLADQDIMQFILHAGFTTAENITQISGRGVGMDVVHAEIKQLGGSMSIASEAGSGTTFSVRLPFTVSVNRALMVNLGMDQYAIPLNAIQGIVRVSPFELEHYYSNPDARFEYAGENFQVRYLGSMLNEDMLPRLEAQSLPLPVILVRSAQHTMALQVDGLMGSREIVVKSLGQQFSMVQGLSGATVMGDGSVVVILDLHALVRKEMAQAAPLPVFAMEETARLAQQEAQTLKTVMVVDDSVTVRKVTTRFLEREGYNVITAKDGVDAIRILQDETPDVMLLDIEMPRMDGFEVAKTIRTTSRWQEIPIIMITSRTGEKHREHALSLGVNRYMGKPYQEEALLESITELLAKH